MARINLNLRNLEQNFDGFFIIFFISVIYDHTVTVFNTYIQSVTLLSYFTLLFNINCPYLQPINNMHVTDI